MSKIARKSIKIPENVTFNINKTKVVVKGPKGQIDLELNDSVSVTCEDSMINVKSSSDTLRSRKFCGTFWSHINNMIIGVSKGFIKSLEINGVGYRVAIKEKSLVMNLGLSHEALFNIPDDVTIFCPDNTHINIEGVDKQKVGQVASKIKLYKPPEPYKGKGFRYVGEKVLRKEGKKK